MTRIGIRVGSARRGSGAAILLALALAFSAQAARAQDNQDLADRIDRLQRELTDLEHQVNSGSGQPAVSGDQAGTAAQSGGDVAASQEVRLQQIESQIRNLTGQVEQLGYNLQQVDQRIDKLSKDIDFRLSALEHGQQPGGGPAAGLSNGGVDNGATGGATGGAYGGASGQPQGAGAAQDQQNQGQPIQAQQAQIGQPALNNPNQPLKQSSLAPQPLGTLTQSQLQAAAAQPQPQVGGTQTAAAATGSYQLQGNTVEEQYQYAFDLLRQANYDEAEKALRAFVSQHPKDFLAGNAQYWLGETYYVRGRYQDAAIAFAEGYQKYPNNSKAPDNLLKLGMSLGQIGKKSEACVAFSELARRFPSAPDNVRERLKQEKHRYSCG
jgi:tol-pal system protein YbgF